MPASNNEPQRTGPGFATVFAALADHQPSLLNRYGIPLLLIALAALIRALLHPKLGGDAPLLIFMFPVVISAWYGGLKSGLFATFSSLLVGTYLFIEPFYSFRSVSQADAIRIIIFVTQSLLISVITGGTRSAQARIRANSKALHVSEQRYGLLIDGVKDYAIYMLNPEGMITSWNAGAERIKGYRAHEIIGKHAACLYSEEDIAQGLPEREMSAAAAGGRLETEGWRVRKDGSRFWANIVMTPLYDANGNIEGYTKVTRDETERRAAQAKILQLNETLQQRVNELQTLLDVMPVGIGLASDTSGSHIRMNPALAELLNLAPHANASLGAAEEERPAYRVYREGIEVTPEQLPMQRAAREGRTVAEEELEIVRADGRRLQLLSYAAPLVNADGCLQGSVGAFLDITARKQSEEALRSSQTQLSAMIDSAMDALISLDAQQRIVVFNRAAEEMLRCSASEVMGQTIDRFIPPAAREAHRRHIPAFGQTGVTNRSMHSLRPLTALRADGEEFPIEATISHVEAGGEKLYTVIMRDITERQRAEEDRTQLLQREQAARAEAEAAVRVREVFLSIAAHELKTPLTALLGFTHVLQRRSKTTLEMPDRDRKALRAIGEQGKRLNRLIETLLDLSRIQLGRLSIEEQRVDVNALAARVVAELEPALEHHSLHLQCDDESCIVLGDELRLEQVLHNLLQNAVKYSPDGGPIHVRVERQLEQIRLSVTDRGIGIPEAAQAFLFLQFYRGSNVDPRRISGLGIGLYIVSQIVGLHGGTINVTSQEGHGSTFTVSLPPWTEDQVEPGTVSATRPTTNSTL